MLQNILGVGTNIAKRIEGLSTARVPIPRWEALRRKLPAGLLSLQTIPGLRPVTTKGSQPAGRQLRTFARKKGLTLTADALRHGVSASRVRSHLVSSGDYHGNWGPPVGYADGARRLTLDDDG